MCRKKFRELRKLTLKCPIINLSECSEVLERALLNSRSRWQFHLDSFAFFTPTWEVPHIWKSAALHWFDRLNLAGVFSFEENAFAIGLVDQGEARAVRVDACEALHKIIQRKVEMFGNARNLLVINSHIPWPSAAIATALTEIVRGRHAKRKSVGHTTEVLP